MVRAKGKGACKHAETMVYGYCKGGRLVGGSHGGKISSYDGGRRTTRRKNRPSHSGLYFN